MEDKLSSLEDENHILRQNAISLSPPLNKLAVVPKPFSEVSFLLYCFNYFLRSLLCIEAIFSLFHFEFYLLF